MAEIAPDSDTAKHQRKIKRLAALYNLDRLDVSLHPLGEYIDVVAFKDGKRRQATINQSIIDWRSVEHVIGALFGKTEKYDA